MNLAGKCVFSKIDFLKTFHQILVAESDISKTVRSVGVYGSVSVMPHKPFNVFMDEALQGLDCCFYYMNDILVASESNQEHMRLLFERLTKFGIIINVSKGVFGVNDLGYLRHVISEKGYPLPTSRVDIVRKFKKTATVRDLQGSLGPLT